ncbi:MAG: amino acid racemase [Candidatus Diapherotrites archaeon]|nr:amino acid racemase [Candidatus Diapherotrites archaeon]
MAREKLGVTDSVEIKVIGNSLVLSKPNGEKGTLISRNCEEIGKMETIGVLGGMGPEATGEFYRRMISICQTKFGAKKNEDFPPIIILNLPTVDVISEKGNEDVLLRFLAGGCVSLKSYGADFVCIPCNTASIFAKRLESEISIMSIIEETAKACEKRGFRRVGLLATETTIKMGAYKNALEKRGIQCIVPNRKQQEIVTECIMNIIAGKKREKKERLLQVIEDLKDKKIEAIILGCTELPIVLRQGDCDITLIDSLQVLAEAAVTRSYRGELLHKGLENKAR